MHDVFISYSHKDVLVADAICHKLEEQGVRCSIVRQVLVSPLEHNPATRAVYRVFGLSPVKFTKL